MRLSQQGNKLNSDTASMSIMEVKGGLTNRLTFGFRCLPSYGNDLRRQYNTILADIAESDLLSSIVSQICHRPIQVGKLDPNLAPDIRQANYSLS